MNYQKKFFIPNLIILDSKRIKFQKNYMDYSFDSFQTLIIHITFDF